MYLGLEETFVETWLSRQDWGAFGCYGSPYSSYQCLRPRGPGVADSTIEAAALSPLALPLPTHLTCHPAVFCEVWCGDWIGDTAGVGPSLGWGTDRIGTLGNGFDSQK